MSDPWPGDVVASSPDEFHAVTAPVSAPQQAANDQFPGQVVDAPAQPQTVPSNAAPDGSGFTDEQKQAILEYAPKATDGPDLERYSQELTGGRARIGNAQHIVDYLKKGGTVEGLGFGAPTVEQAAQKPANPLSMENIRKTVGDALFGLIAPGFGSEMNQAAQGPGTAALAHVANATVGDYGPEVAGLIDTIIHGGHVDNNVAHERAILQAESEGHPVASAAGELGGIALTAPLTGAAGEAANLGKAGRTLQAMAEGATYGSGAAGPGNRVQGAVTGAALAPVASLAMRGAAAIPAAVRQGANVVAEGTPGIARRIIARAIRDDANTPEAVGQTIAEAQGNGVPMALGDTGENVRGLLGASSRASGLGRTIVRDALTDRQQGLADRVAGHIERDLGPVANPHQLNEQLLQKAQADAAPLYDAAYARPGADAFGKSVAPLLGRPSMRQAMGNAYKIAQEEGRDPTTLGFDLDSEGNVTLKRVPSWQTMDYVKRGMDDVIEGYRDPTSGRLNLDTEGRAINNTQRSFLAAFDQANPDYAAARAAYAGPVRANTAMETGRSFLNMHADDIEARMRDMTDHEKEMARLGLRTEMVRAIQAKGDTADVVGTLVGTGKKRAMLARLFGDRKAFQRFVDTLGQEREAWRSYKTALLGSPTAPNQMDDATLQAVTGSLDLAISGGIPVTTAASKAIKFFGVKASKKAQQHIAALLSNTDPMAIRELAAHLRAEAQNRGINVPRLKLVAGTGGKGATVAVTSQLAQ